MHYQNFVQQNDGPGFVRYLSTRHVTDDHSVRNCDDCLMSFIDQNIDPRVNSNHTESIPTVIDIKTNPRGAKGHSETGLNRVSYCTSAAIAMHLILHMQNKEEEADASLWGVMAQW